MNQKTFTFLFVSIFFLAACAPLAPGGSSPTITILPPPTNTVQLAAPTNTPSPVPEVATPTPGHISVDLTPAQLAAIQALAKKYDLPVDQIKLVSTEAMTWDTGCLGVVLPGVMCTRGPVEGFRILLMVNGEQFEFHTNQDGTNVIDAAQQLATIRLVVYTSDHSIQIVDPNIPLGSTYNQAFNGMLSSGGSIAGTAYVLDFNQARAVAVDAKGVHDLSFIQNPNYGIAIWRGGPGTQPRLAWGTQPGGSFESSTLQISAPDGSNPETLLTQEITSTLPTQLVAELWSADGQSLYFSKEPVGLGGYILFTGASNLYTIDLSTKKAAALIASESLSSPTTCLDAISGDYRLVADHCSKKTITIRDLTTGGTSTIQPPEGVSGFGALGSARFSPDGKRLAFALAKRNPDNEQGWVAVSDGISGGSKLVLTGAAGAYYTVLGWLDDQTLLVQSNPLNCTNCENQIWTVGIDGSNLTKVADGSFLTVLDNR